MQVPVAVAITQSSEITPATVVSPRGLRFYAQLPFDATPEDTRSTRLAHSTRRMYNIHHPPGLVDLPHVKGRQTNARPALGNTHLVEWPCVSKAAVPYLVDRSFRCSLIWTGGIRTYGENRTPPYTRLSRTGHSASCVTRVRGCNLT